MQLHHSSTAYKGAFAGRRSNKTNPAVIQAPAAPCRAVRRDATSDNADGQVQQQHNAGAAQPPTTDPEAKYKRYGSHFGGRFWLSDLVDSAPRVRVRTSASRQRSELLELAVLNERLAGEVEPWEARARLEVLRNRRHAWNAVYELINGADAAATLEMIEAAAEQVRSLEEIYSLPRCTCHACDIIRGHAFAVVRYPDIVPEPGGCWLHAAHAAGVGRHGAFALLHVMPRGWPGEPGGEGGMHKWQCSFLCMGMSP